jgi:hypothetical protein
MNAPQRRRWMQLAAVGALGPAGLAGWIAKALAAGTAGGAEGLVRLDGSATINGAPAKPGMPVQAGDKVVTGKDSSAVVVVGKDAFLLRSHTVIAYGGRNAVVTRITVEQGKTLAVFGAKDLEIKAANASIGIRGTGAYLEVEPKQVYFCLCYGEAVIAGPKMPDKVVKTTHHEQPLYLRDDGSTLTAEPGPFLNHTDAELVMLEALCGREPPFMKGGQYPAKRY